jgi:O-acetyl-ADP-ribose deacetylase (regulator of RNase III)
MQHLFEIEIIKSDITRVPADAIVNAANSSLMGGGGVDGAIHRAGGSAILEECKKIVKAKGSCKTGEAVITTAGNLPAKFVIHTVGPVWNNGNRDEEIKLANCYSNSLQLAVENDVKTISFPNISTGIYRFPKDLAAQISIETVIDFCTRNKEFMKILFVCFDEENFHLVNEYYIKLQAAR